MLTNRIIFVRDEDRKIIIRDDNRRTIIRKNGSVRIIEVARQGPPGAAGQGLWTTDVFEIQNDGDREFTLTESLLNGSISISLNGLIQAGFSVVGQTLILDADVQTMAGDVLFVHYLRYQVL